jgi:quercetin dioxygenase-like cupin family protein
MLTRGDEPHGLDVAKMRIEITRPRSELRVHPGYEWFTVLSGTIRLQLGERVILIEAGQAAQFSTMSPHAITAKDGPAELIGIFDRDGRRAHLDAVALTPPPG